jgi:hypothetical protein
MIREADAKRDEAAVVIRRPVVEFRKERSTPEARPIAPANGAVARVDDHVSAFCAVCERWIDCWADIEPEVALERHGVLVH